MGRENTNPNQLEQEEEHEEAGQEQSEERKRERGLLQQLNSVLLKHLRRRAGISESKISRGRSSSVPGNGRREKVSGCLSWNNCL